ncbi:MAG TPA: hypothetical protein PKK48_05000 [Phycisphaerae bacterium]|nr:hypothetical protein [Phycisphaerae bacterium]
MTGMKKAVIATLLCLNVGLLAGLFYVNMSSADAQLQIPFKTTNYVVSTVSIGANWEGVCIIDMASRKLLCLKWDRSSKKIVPIGGKNVLKDANTRSR